MVRNNRSSSLLQKPKGIFTVNMEIDGFRLNKVEYYKIYDGLLTCRREVGYILARMKVLIKKESQNSLKLLENYNVRYHNVLYLMRFWRKFIKRYFIIKAQRAFTDIHGLPKNRVAGDDDTLLFDDEKSRGQENTRSRTQYRYEDSETNFEKIKISFFIREYFIYMMDAVHTVASAMLVQNHLKLFKQYSKFAYLLATKFKDTIVMC